MAISIVSKQYGDDSQTPIVDPSINNESIFPVSEQIPIITPSGNQDIFAATENATESSSDAIQETTIVNKDNNDSVRLTNLHPEEKANPIEEQTTVHSSSKSVIPNMYIKADAQTLDVSSDVAIFSEEKKEETSSGFDMDDLLGYDTQVTIDNNQDTISRQQENVVQPNTVEAVNTNKATEQTIAQDPFVVKKDGNKDQKKIVTNKQLLSTAPKKSLMKSLAMIATGLFGIVVIGFIVMTMFPAGIDGNTSVDAVTEEDILTQEIILEETLEDHSAADTQEEQKTPQEMARGELVNYSTLGESYYEIGRDLKDRNMVRYALYVEKKAKDLIDMLDLDPNMDTKDIVVYFAQFDDYLKTLEDWKAGLGDSLPVAGSSTIIEEDMFGEPQNPFIDIETNNLNDANTGTIQSNTSFSEPE